VRGSTKEESPRSAITEVALHTGVVAFTALRHCTRYPGITHEHTDHVNTSKEKENKCPVPLNTGRENHHDCHVSLLFFPDSRRSSSNESRQATTRGRFASADDASSRLLKYVFFSLSLLLQRVASLSKLFYENRVRELDHTGRREGHRPPLPPAPLFLSILACSCTCATIGPKYYLNRDHYQHCGRAPHAHVGTPAAATIGNGNEC
jgi:hypothetical protein